MALTANDNERLQKQQNGLLDINSKDYWFDKLRPALLEFNKTYHTDRELNRTIVEVMNKVDSMICREEYMYIPDSYMNLLSCVQSKGYMISGPMRYGSDEEKKKVLELIDKFSDFSMILKYEKVPEEEEHEKKDRINYQPPNGGNMGFNLDDLSNRGPKPGLRERIPNMQNEKEKYAY